jgi:hypothetical protein
MQRMIKLVAPFAVAPVVVFALASCSGGQEASEGKPQGRLLEQRAASVERLQGVVESLKVFSDEDRAALCDDTPGLSACTGPYEMLDRVAEGFGDAAVEAEYRRLLPDCDSRPNCPYREYEPALHHLLETAERAVEEEKKEIAALREQGDGSDDGNGPDLQEILENAEKVAGLVLEMGKKMGRR